MNSQDTNATIIASVVAAYAARADVGPQDIVELLRRLREEFSSERAPAAGARAAEPTLASEMIQAAPAAEPCMPITEAVTRDKVFCLCCGKGFKMLKRHITSEHGLSEEAYRRMFGLAEDFPLVAPSYSERKANYAKKVGFGKHDRGVTAPGDMPVSG
ncbi:MucR family transcriptional regulator [Litorisediminicola beolgyonensis]|uniref:MucR family transcriptional regulator n=1 Tax=Litorisediminicola beolgyonensis TaxID=1173614 RepID=A0ABW3ZG30_9RHOB